MTSALDNVELSESEEMHEKGMGKTMGFISQRKFDESDWPVAIFTRSEGGDLIWLQDVLLPEWMRAELRFNGHVRCEIAPPPATTWSVHDDSAPGDTCDALVVELERYYRFEHDRLVVDGGLIQDSSLADLFIKCYR